MVKAFYNRQAQSFLEYALIVAIIAAALLAMSRYMNNAVSARLKQAQMELDETRR